MHSQSLGTVNMDLEVLAEKYRVLIASDERFNVHTYRLINEAMCMLVPDDAPEGHTEHIEAWQLAAVTRDYLIREYGYVAAGVATKLGIQTSRGLGNAVFAMVDHKLLGKQDTDRVEDFDDLYSTEDLTPISIALKFDPNGRKWHADFLAKGKADSYWIKGGA